MMHAVAQRLQRAVGAVPFARARLVTLRADEERQAVGIAPARITELCPLIVVRLVAAEIDHPVDGAGAADHFAAGQIEHAVTKVLLRLALIAQSSTPDCMSGRKPAGMRMKGWRSQGPASS